MEAVSNLLRSGEDLTRGRQVRAFEEEFAAYVGAKYAVACSSGTAALWLAVKTAEKFWDRVTDEMWRVPAITFAATRNVCAEFDVVDVDNHGLANCSYNRQIDVLYAGQPLLMHAGLIDACHALGSVYPDEHGSRAKVGAIGTCCFSFHPNKTITTGEGGMVTTVDEGMAREMRRLRDNGIVRSKADPPGYYDNSGFGLNFHMNEISAALGRSQLKRIGEILYQRRNLARRYFWKLTALATPVISQVEDTGNNACHIFPVLIDFEALGIPRDKVMYELARRGIETQVHYVPLQRGLPGAEEFYRRELTLPLHCHMEDEDVDYVCESLQEVLDG